MLTTVFRPRPIADIGGRNVFFATTAPPQAIPLLASYLERTFACTIVAVSPRLSERVLLNQDLDAAAGTFDVLLTELKAAAIDVVAEAGEALGVPTVLCDNELVSTDGEDLEPSLDAVVQLALQRGLGRTRQSARGHQEGGPES